MSKERIEDIPTECFNEILALMRSPGWKQRYEYDAFNAWIDYGKVILKKDSMTVTFEWTNWFEGEIEGPASVISYLKGSYSL